MPDEPQAQNVDQVLAHLSVLKLEPGDRLVLSCKGYVSRDAADRIREHLATWAPGVKVLVLDNGCTLGVVRSTSEPTPDPSSVPSSPK